jgi:hypothetical protein
MSPYSKPAPRGFRWADTPAMRAVLVVLIVASLGLSIYASSRYVGLVNCLQDHAAADATRTKKIADATDVERAADRNLLMGPREGRTPAELRQRALDARAETDRVRAANPAPSGESAACR